MSEFSHQPSQEAKVEELSPTTTETSSATPLNAFPAITNPPKLKKPQRLNPHNILALQRTIGNQAVQRLMTKGVFQAKTSVKVGARGKNNPVLLDIDRLLEEYNNITTPPTLARKQQILDELSVVKDWLDKKGDDSNRQSAMQELWNDIVKERGNSPQDTLVSLQATQIHPSLYPPSFYADAKSKGINIPLPTGLDVAVQELQNKLNTAVIPSPNLAGGVFDVATETAVKAFKTAKGLSNPTDGAVEADTWAALDAAGTSAVGQVSYKSSQDQLGKQAGSNVKYSWQVTDTELRISVKINFGGAVPNKAGVISNTQDGIKTVWNQFKIVETTSKKARDLVFDPQSVTSKGMDVAEINLSAGNGRSDAGNWYVGDPDLKLKTGPHEFGHIVGLDDEYERAHADYFKLTGLNPLQEKSGLTDAKATACANKLKTALAAGTDKPSAAVALVKAANVLKEYDIYNTDGTGQEVLKKFPAAITELNRVAKLLVKSDLLSLGKLSSDKKVEDILEESVKPFGFDTKSIMGGMENATAAHDHGVELRHVRFFTNFVKQAVPGNYIVEKK